VTTLPLVMLRRLAVQQGVMLTLLKVQVVRLCAHAEPSAVVRYCNEPHFKMQQIWKHTQLLVMVSV
jgi:hypothetical protein